MVGGGHGGPGGIGPGASGVHDAGLLARPKPIITAGCLPMLCARSRRRAPCRGLIRPAWRSAADRRAAAYRLRWRGWCRGWRGGCPTCPICVISTGPSGWPAATPILKYRAIFRCTAGKRRRRSAPCPISTACISPARATAPALFSVGLMDTVCPPSSVYAAYHAYAGPKSIESYTFNDHEGGGPVQEAAQVAWAKGKF